LCVLSHSAGAGEARRVEERAVSAQARPTCPFHALLQFAPLADAPSRASGRHQSLRIDAPGLRFGWISARYHGRCTGGWRAVLGRHHALPRLKNCTSFTKVARNCPQGFPRGRLLYHCGNNFWECPNSPKSLWLSSLKRLCI